MSKIKNFLPLLLGIAVVLAFMFGFVIAGGQRNGQKSDEDLLYYFKNLSKYNCKVSITTINDKQKLSYDCKLYYLKDNGSRLEIGKDRVLIYKGDKIYISDLVTKNKYTVDEDQGELYAMSFIQQYVKLMYVSDDTKYYEKQDKSTKLQLVDFSLPFGNSDMTRAVLSIDITSRAPQKITIYDSEGKEKAEIKYSDFDTKGKIDSSLFSVA
ncbi:hypothetical protein IAI10_05540 [Clostridium sp. 19966]|uniref:germination lipoprotein GerS-related protein n=1 Tax=Clostridium sp. 19966 TaxID=2768166 RepID=UPI0028DEDF3C|nr:germination lipoprotein GerS-related protein [Clostridium sp. 19966]MDT8716110.1 hypothetical protein [Clostridium sp. 19966]